jgi:hypothetical protein
MRTQQKLRNTRCDWGRVVLAAVAIACCSTLPGCRKANASAAMAVPATKMADPATRDLRAIGDRATTAIIAKNTSTLLEYDHDPEDQASLQSKSGELYCYLFDSSCIAGGKTRAVYDLFSAAPKLGIDASVTSVDGKQYGLLMFYDKSQVSATELYSPDFLCSDKALKTSASWHFILTDGKWTTTTLFDYKTEKPCKTSS